MEKARARVGRAVDRAVESIDCMNSELATAMMAMRAAQGEGWGAGSGVAAPAWSSRGEVTPQA